MNKIFPFAFSFIFTIALSANMVALAAEKSGSAATFDALTTLAGEWKGDYSGTEVKLTYTLTANGTALMEEFQPKIGPVMITMFTVDGDHLVALHYCAAGNQPYMKTEEIKEPQNKQVAFKLERITGMATPDDWHNTGLVMILEDKDHLTQEWTFVDKGETGKTVFHFTRGQ